jgi:hypothetical protein
MPFNPREFFLAMPVIQDYIFQYVQEAAHGIRDPVYQFTFRMSDEFEDYEAPLKVAKENAPQFDYTGWTGKNRSEFTCFIELDEVMFERAKKISHITKKHITESLGILIGSKPRKQPLLPPARCIEGKGVLILNWDGTRLMEDAVALQNWIGKDTDSANLKEPISMNDVDILDIDTATGVIGPASVLTHLAAAYNRTVVEIFSDEESYRLYNNEGIDRYQAIIGSPTIDNIKEAWRNVCPIDTGPNMKLDELEIQTEPQVFSVENAEEK